MEKGLIRIEDDGDGVCVCVWVFVSVCVYVCVGVRVRVYGWGKGCEVEGVEGAPDGRKVEMDYSEIGLILLGRNPKCGIFDTEIRINIT